jgi:hypothetical protein
MAARLLLSLLTALALVGGGYWWGSSATDNAWTARQATAAQAAADALAQETRRADQAAAHYLTEHLDQEDRYAALDLEYRELARHAPLVVPRSVPVVSACSGIAPAVEPTPAATPAPGAVGTDGLGLTLAAVRMWNGALTGTDAPAGACGLAGAAAGADAACAEDSGLSLDDAWANHRANAKACADDRQRFRALIDFLNLRQQP